jgi:hypothetical protein
MLNTSKDSILETIKGKIINNIVFDEKYIRLELNDDTKLEVEIELPSNCKMGVYASQVKRSRVWL